MILNFIPYGVQNNTFGKQLYPIRYSHIYPPYMKCPYYGTLHVHLVEGNLIILKVRYTHSPLTLLNLPFFAKKYR